jgi:predicted pyridoxine 5'-phosphate oxidase superfamily flavin-nucleotide-binding protein
MTRTLPILPAWHDGETFLQEKLGVAERMAAIGDRVIRDFMPEQHRAFYAQLPFIVLGSVDAEGDAWASILTGRPGFMSSPDPATLDIAVQADPSDPAGEGLREGEAIGLLGIEMHTRRRNRMNGILAPVRNGMRVMVDQSFGNCPRYIQLRDFEIARDPEAPSEALAETLSQLDMPARAMIAAADTFFVATYADRGGRRQVDVSHRGGKAGFVRIGADGTLTVPDFSGNLFFSTLGNMVLNGKAGLIFVDYERGDVLQMTGDADVILESPQIDAFEGAERLWSFRPRRIVRRQDALALRWSFRENGWSPSSLETGDWAQAARR